MDAETLFKNPAGEIGEAWVSFATEQTKAYLAFWESLMPKAKGSAKKGGAKTKEGKTV